MTSPLNLLYVDDDPDIRMVVQMALALDPAITVRTATSGAEALHFVLDGGWHPDAIVLDVVMPDMTGLELLETLRENQRLRDIPAIFMTARGRDADLADYRRMEAKGTILKPFDPLGLAAEVRAILGEP